MSSSMDTEVSGSLGELTSDSNLPPKKRQKAENKLGRGKNKSASALVCGIPLRGEDVEEFTMPDISDSSPSILPRPPCPKKQKKVSKPVKSDDGAPKTNGAVASEEEPSPKKRASRKRSALPPPREKSQREIKPVKEIYVVNGVGPKFRARKARPVFENTNKYWEESDLKNFLEMLQKHGSEKVLYEHLFKGRTVEDQRRLLNVTTAPSRHRTRSIRTYERHSNLVEKIVVREQEDTKAPVTQWLEKLLIAGKGALNARALTSALHFIADFEDHPPVEECDGIDFAAIYRYLAEFSVGNIPPDLNCESSQVVLELMRELAHGVAPCLNKGKEYMKQIFEVETWTPDIDRNAVIVEPSDVELEETEIVKEGDPEKIISSLNQIPGLNPFKISLEMLCGSLEE